MYEQTYSVSQSSHVYYKRIYFCKRTMIVMVDVSDAKKVEKISIVEDPCTCSWDLPNYPASRLVFLLAVLHHLHSRESRLGDNRVECMSE
jgi:hypothetical protein